MVKIVSWNINSIRIRINLLKHLIDKIKPDIILLQEIKCSNDDFPDFYTELDYKLIVNGQKGKYGVASLIKKGFSTKTIELSKSIFQKESRTNFFYLDELDLTVLNVYTPNGNPLENNEKFAFKINWLNEIKKVSEEYINEMRNLLIAGDFNVIENKKDATKFEGWENDALGHIDTRQKFREIISSGLQNVARVFYEPGQKFSYWDYQRASWERNDGLLIDHFLISPKFLSSVKSINFESTYRGMEKPSDHIPVWIELNI